MKYSKVIGLLMILTTMSLITKAQVKNGFNKKTRESKAQEILALSRKAIYKDIEPEQIKSLHFKTKNTLITKSTIIVDFMGEMESRETEKSKIETEEAVHVDLPNKIRHTAVMREATKNQIENFIVTTMILNGDKVFFDAKRIVDGRVLDINAILNSENIPEKAKKSIRKRQEKAKATITKKYIKEKVLKIILTYLLYNPWGEDSSQVKFAIPTPYYLLCKYWEKDAFIYVGKAKVMGTKADVLELKSLSQKIRFFFDEKTHLLLLMTRKIKEKNTKINFSFYFSDYKLKGGVMVAGKIKYELKARVKSVLNFIVENNKAMNRKGNNLTKLKHAAEFILEKFEINPVLKSEIFDKK